VQCIECCCSEYPAETFESLQVLRAWHLIRFLV
jgi:hypothetical protein